MPCSFKRGLLVVGYLHEPQIAIFFFFFCEKNA